MIQQTQGAPRKTPLFTTDEEEEEETIVKSPYNDEINNLEKGKKSLYDKLKKAKQSQIK